MTEYIQPDETDEQLIRRFDLVLQETAQVRQQKWEELRKLGESPIGELFQALQWLDHSGHTRPFGDPYDRRLLKRGPSVRVVGERIFNAYNRSFHDFLCAKSGQNAKLRDHIWAAISTSGGAAVGAVAAGLVVGIEISQGLATVVATLLLRDMFKPMKREICGAWAEQIKAAEREHAQDTEHDNEGATSKRTAKIVRPNSSHKRKGLEK